MKNKLLKMVKIVEAIYKDGSIRPLKSLNLKDCAKVYILLPEGKNDDEIIEKIKKLKDLKVEKGTIEEVYYGRYSY